MRRMRKSALKKIKGLRLRKETQKKINNKTMMIMISIVAVRIKKQPLIKNWDLKMKLNQKI